MGVHSALKAWTTLENVETVLAIELMCAAQGLDLRRPLKSSAPMEAVHALVRQHIPSLERDRILYGDIQKMITLVQSNDIQREAHTIIGTLL